MSLALSPGGAPRPAPGRTPSSAPVLDELPIVLAVMGGQSPAFITAALENGGASVRVTSDLGAARRGSGGRCATVVFDPPVITASIRAGLRALSRQGPVLLVKLNATTRERIDLLNCGADSVVASVDPKEVVAALGAVLRRSRMPATPRVPQCAGDLRVDLADRTASAGGRTVPLTALEFDLLAYFVAHAGQALSRERLLEDVWGYAIGGRETVTVHVRRLRQKIEDDPSRPTRLQTVWGIGYRLETRVPGGNPTPRSPSSEAADPPHAPWPRLRMSPPSMT